MHPTQLMSSVMSIFAHQDDETFSAGGVLAKYSSDGSSYALSISSDPKREDEFKDACGILGAKPILLPYSSISPANELDIKNQLMDKIREHKPNIIITHVNFDYHHEHRLVRKIVEEAVEWVSHTTGKKEAFQIKGLWAAETTVLIPSPEIYIDITDYNHKRLNAIECYESQNHKGGKGFYHQFHNTRTKLRGIQADVEHAEAFVQVPITLSGSFKPKKMYDKFPEF